MPWNKWNHAAVAYFHRVFIKNLMQPVGFWKMIIAPFLLSTLLVKLQNMERFDTDYPYKSITMP